MFKHSTKKSADIRETASIIFTNFDMIHASILPHEDLWRTSAIFLPSINLQLKPKLYGSFLKNLKLVAVDELHYYSDLFGRYTISQYMICSLILR